MALKKKKSLKSLLHNWTDTDKSTSCLVFSDVLDVDFELRDDVWDDIDDEKLVFASNFANRELGKVILTKLFVSYLQIISQAII